MHGGKKISLDKEEWYQCLIEELKSIVVERGFQSRMEIIEGKYEVGNCIIQNFHNFERSKIYGENIVQQVAESLETKPRNIWYCIQFAQEANRKGGLEKYLGGLKEGKNLSWRKIALEYLPEHKEEEEENTGRKKPKMIICPKCGWEFEIRGGEER